MSSHAALLFFLLPLPLVADAPALPDFVTEYLNDSQLEYELPEGQFDSYLLEILEEEDKPEPWAVGADFNGDSISDWAGLLRDRYGQLELLVVSSVGKNYSHQVLTPLGSDSDNLNSYVVLQPPGRLFGFPLGGDDERPVLDLANPGVHLFYFEAASVLYYRSDASFLEFVTGD